MIRSAISSVIAVILLGVFANFYLQPNDFIGCGVKPGGLPYCETADAVVSISGGDTRARTTEAVNLYKNGWAKLLIFSGAAEDKTGLSNAVAMKNIAMELGVKESAIIIDEFAETTQENAKNTSSLLAENDIKTVILVTSGYHQRRANLEFNRYNEDVTVYNRPAKNDKDWSSHWWLTFKGWWLAISELIKVVIFYVSGLWL